jgi:hypothetical protein
MIHDAILSRSTDALLIIALFTFALFRTSSIVGVCVAVNVIIFVRLAKRLLLP